MLRYLEAVAFPRRTVVWAPSFRLKCTVRLYRRTSPWALTLHGLPVVLPCLRAGHSQRSLLSTSLIASSAQCPDRAFGMRSYMQRRLAAAYYVYLILSGPMLQVLAQFNPISEGRLNAHPADTRVHLAETRLPTHYDTINSSTPTWQGRVWHYNSTDPAPREASDFKVFIIAHLHTPSSRLRATSASKPISKRSDAGIVDNVSTTSYFVSISTDQAATAAARALMQYVKEPKDILLQGVLLSFSIGIVSGITSWYITNQLQVDNDDSADTCDIASLRERGRRPQSGHHGVGGDYQERRSWPSIISVGDSKKVHPRNYERRKCPAMQKIRPCYESYLGFR